MENVRLTIAVGAAILIYKRGEITVWQKIPTALKFRVRAPLQDHTSQNLS